MSGFKEYPVGKAQQTILDALGLTAGGFSSADIIFSNLNIVVSSKRVGRKSVPVVTVVKATAQQNIYGDYDIDEPKVDSDTLAKLSKWMDK